MAMMTKPMTMLLIAATLMVVVAPLGEAAVGCGTVVSDISPCAPYLTGQGPIGSCCSGVKSLYGAAQTTPDKQSVCNCLKSIATSYAGLDLNKAAGLPAQCGLDIPYQISPSTDCSKVQ